MGCRGAKRILTGTPWESAGKRPILGVTSKAPSSSTATLKVVSRSEAFLRKTTRTWAVPTWRGEGARRGSGGGVRERGEREMGKARVQRRKEDKRPWTMGAGAAPRGL